MIFQANIFALLVSIVAPKRLYFGGGDDPGGAEALELETSSELDETQIAQDVAAINALFGQTEYDYAGVPGTEGFYEALPSTLNLSGSVDDVMAQVSDLTAYFEELNAPEGTLETLGAFDPDVLQQEAEDASGVRSQSLDDVYANIMGYSMGELDTQLERKSADVKAMLMDRGLSRSTVGQSVLDRLGEIYDTQEAEFQQGAAGTVSGLEASDEALRMDLVGLIESGGSYTDAAANAAATMGTTLEGAQSDALTQDLSNLFAGMNELYGQQQYVDAYNTGQAYGGTNIVTPGTTSTSGTVLSY